MVPFPVPPAPQLHQPELLDEVHAELEVTVNEVAPAEAVTLRFEGETESVGTKDVAVKVAIIPIAACGVQT